MIVELGHYALVLAFFLSLVQAAAPLLGAARNKQAWMMMGRQAAMSVASLALISFLSLTHAFALTDLSVRAVAENSHTMKPLVYKISALWAHHEGSMLLWFLILSLWGAALSERAKGLPPHFKARALSVLGMISAGTIAFILFTSNPFRRLLVAAPEGLDLNPVLQDPLLAIHPPFLYAGYVGFAVPFAFAVAALIEGKVDKTFAAALKSWTLAAWGFLTIGIALGSFWAYYELGWGGFWFWDPVENASLLPWLAGLALLHSLSTLEKQGALGTWAILLAILAFSFSLLGTFLVRSGVLTSVHAFASDPLRGIFILAFLTAAAGGAFLLYGLRAGKIATGATFALVSKESALLLNNVLIAGFAASVFMGTLYPLFMSALGLSGVSVGGPYYVAVALPLLLPFALLMGIAPRTAWKEDRAKTVLKKNLPPLLATLALLAGFSLTPHDKSGVLLVGIAASGWILFATLHDAASKAKSWKSLPLSYCAMILAHSGFALLIAGAVLATQLAQEKILWMKPGGRTVIGGNHVALLTVEAGLGKNYNADRALFSVQEGNSFSFMTPEKRWYPATERETSEAALLHRGLGLLYVVLGGEDEKDANRRVIRLYYHPFILLVYLGAGLMALGGFVAASDKRRGRA